MVEKEKIKKDLSKNKARTKKRIRSKEDKFKKLQEIIDAGSKLYVTKGWEGFGMRALAKQLGMSEGNLYNYIKSKRELYIAIRSKYFEYFTAKLKKIINKNRGKISYIDLFMKIAEFYLDFAFEDFPRYNMINIIAPPSSDEKGPFEQTYQTFNILKIIQDLIEEATEAKELKVEDSELLAYHFYGLVYGAVKVIREFDHVDPILEPIIPHNKLAIEEYRSLIREKYRIFFLKQIKDQLESSKLT